MIGKPKASFAAGSRVGMPVNSRAGEPASRNIAAQASMSAPVLVGGHTHKPDNMCAHSRVRSQPAVLLGLLLALLLVLGGCTITFNPKGSGEQGAPNSAEQSGEIKPITAPMPKIPAQLGKFYRQGVTWEDCGDNLQCGEYTVPLDYEHPNDGVIHIAVTKRLADGARVGALLVNPGGPGGAGQELASQASAYFPSAVTDHFDVIGFDPRGVGESEPIECVSDEKLSKLVEASYPSTPAGQEAARKDAQELAAGCQAHSGKLLPFVGTESAARDMDIIRHVEGDPKLYYVGFSYGTSLGAEYAELFPQNVGRMVLDGAVASTSTNFEQSKAQLIAFENALDDYLKYCLESQKRCPFNGSIADARQRISQLFEQALAQPFPTSDPDHPLTQAGLMYGIITPLYSSAYGLLTNAFKQLIEKNDGSAFYVLFNAYLEREDGKFSSNSIVANHAITCADYPVEGDREQWQRQAKELAEVAPVLGPAFGYDDEVCAAWPYHPTKRLGNYHAQGSDPIVVVGTSGDPATPYQWAQDLAGSLDNAVLVTWQGSGHTAYSRSTPCVQDPINEYLLKGTVPKDGLTCKAK